MVRERWLNLNGRWEFEIDNGRSGRDRKLHEAKRLNGCIVVPFCPESKLPGVERKDFMAAVWYRREFSVPADRDLIEVISGLRGPHAMKCFTAFHARGLGTIRAFLFAREGPVSHSH